MNILIKETGERDIFTLIDPASNCCYVSDFIGNTGATINGQFTWSEQDDAYICDQGTYDWWRKVIDDQQALNWRIAELRSEHGQEAVHNAIVDYMGYCDLEDEAATLNAALDDAFGVSID